MINVADPSLLIIRDHVAKLKASVSVLNGRDVEIAAMLRELDDVKADMKKMESAAALLAATAAGTTLMVETEQSSGSSVSNNSNSTERQAAPAVAPACGAGNCMGVSGAVQDSRDSSFVISGLPEGGLGEDCAALVCETVCKLMGISINVSSAFRMGKPDPNGKLMRKIKFRVENRSEAEGILYNMTQLAGKGVTIWDVLSSAELTARHELWPKFQFAKEMKLRAFSTRARLFVDGLEVSAA